MSDLLLNWDRPPKPLAIICDIDDTLTVGFDVPIVAGCEVLRAINRQKISVHYVTARPEASREMTEKFMADHGLPGWKNLYFCPHWQPSRVHKAELHERLAKEYRVIASIGDNEEEMLAAQSAGIPFVQVAIEQPEFAWQVLAKLIEAAMSQ